MMLTAGEFGEQVFISEFTVLEAQAPPQSSCSLTLELSIALLSGVDEGHQMGASGTLPHQPSSTMFPHD